MTNFKKYLGGFLGVMLVMSGSLISNFVWAERIKDLATISGVRDNQLVGYGIVVGLNGTGDKTNSSPFTVQSVKSMLNQLGVTIPANVNLQMKNVAAVMLHATLPPFSKPGQKIDVTASSLGDAKSIRGGNLLMAPLKGADGQVYAIAQGSLVVGGFGAESTDGSKITVNIPSVGRIPNGATVERIVPSSFAMGNHIVFNLHEPDFTTATRMAEVINKTLGAGSAVAVDGSSVSLIAPKDNSQRVGFVSLIENITFEPAEAAAKIVVNSRTGTIVIGRNVSVSAAAVTHGSLTVTITNKPIVSQPGPLSDGQTAVVDNQDIQITEENNRMFLFDPGITLKDIVDAVNSVGAAPGDLVAILEALKQAGALKAELIII